MVLRTALAEAGVASSSPSHVCHASSSKIAGIRGSASKDLIERRMRSLAGTVTMTHTSNGAGRSEIVNRCQTKAKPRGRPSRGSTVHCRVSVLPDGLVTSSPSLKVRNTTMPRCPPWKGFRNGSFESTVSDRAWIGRGRRQSLGSGKPHRILTTRRWLASASHTMTGNKPFTRKAMISSLLPLPGPSPPPPSVSGCENATTSLQDASAVNFPHMAARYHRRWSRRYLCCRLREQA